MTKPPGKILVIRGGGIGDFILTLPVFSALKERFPRSHLEVLGYPHICNIAQAGGLADAIHSIEARPLASFFAHNCPLDKTFVEYFASFALIVSYLYDPDHFFRENILRCSKAQFIQGPHRPSETSTVHAAEVFLKPLERLAIFAPDKIPRLKLSNTPDGRLPQGSWLAVAPGSGSERKNWPQFNWIKLIEYLQGNSEVKVLMVGGEAEGDWLEQLALSMSSNRIQIAKSLPLPTLAQWLLQCTGYLGNDSGISHLASALGLKGLILWGESNSAIWRPLAPSIGLLEENKNLSGLPLDRVLRSLKNNGIL